MSRAKELYQRVGPWLFFTPCGLATMAAVGLPILVVTAPFSLPTIGLAIGIDKYNAWRSR